MTGKSEESDEERSISTEVEEEERVDTEEKQENERKEAVRLEKLEVQLEEDSDLLQSERDDNLSEEQDAQSHDKEGRQDEDCPFCDYMRLGPCGTSFSTWEKCTEMAEEDGSNVFEKCTVVTGILTACMRANLSYYGPVLEAQKVIDDPLIQAEAMVEPEGNAENTLKSTEKQVDIQDEADVKVND